MATTLITENPWETLTDRVASSSRPCHVAVAYFGKGASKFLPLPKGSRLVVDASKGAVEAGQTCPDELLKLHRKGVKIFSREHLHAKVFVIGKTAYVGSTNASSRSRDVLLEAIVETTDTASVSAAREFVSEHCLVSLGPKQLKELSEIYRPPRLSGGLQAGRAQPKNRIDPKLNDVYLAVIDDEEFPEGEEDLRKEGMTEALRERRHRTTTHKIDEIWWAGQFPLGAGELLIQVWKSNGRTWVYPPGFVLNWVKDSTKSTRYVYVERPLLPRYSLEVMVKKLGYGSKGRLIKSGRISDKTFARNLLRIWQA